MVIIGNYQGFNIFEPAPEIIPASREKVDAGIAVNKRVLQNLSAEEKAAPAMPVTGTFLCAHAPDYVGTPTLLWDTAQWKTALEKLREKKIDTVIFQASVWNELHEVYYSSKKFASFRSWNVVEPMLLAARDCGMTVFLGGYGSVSGWSPLLTEQEEKEEIDRQCGCFEELMTYKELFDGIYYAPETAFSGVRNRQKEERLHNIYQTYFRRIKELAPEKKILISPASRWIPSKEQEFFEAWTSLFEDVPLDILAPQDSIGCGGCTLENISAMWQLWRRTADSLGITLWANTELFERITFGGPKPFKNAEKERIFQQRRAVSPFVEKCICWEALYFDLP